MITEMLRDLDELVVAASTPARQASRADILLRSDSWTVLTLSRLPHSSWGRRVPMLRWLVRRVLTAGYGIELGKNVELGHGVHFVHTLGVVIGGNAKVGPRVKFYGNNTVGTARDDGYPVIEEDVKVGCGARILGPIRVGARSVIGANAVVLADIPADSVVVGVPGRVVTHRSAVAAARATA